MLTAINNTSTNPISGTFSNLPDGSTLTLTYNGTNYNFTASYEGGGGYNLTLTYDPPPPPVISSATSAIGTVNTSFNYQITTNNTATSYSLTGTLPTGLNFSTSTGAITGTATQTGTFTVTIGAANAGVTSTASLTLVISSTSYTFSTIAGATSLGSVDDIGTAARFNYPAGAAVDGNGNVYVADTNNETIRKITPSGVVTTFAGSPYQIGSSDGTGSAARFWVPTGLAVDGSGNVYVTDLENDTIRKITPGGVVTTIAGSAGNQGSSDGTGNAASFYHPYGITVDVSGNLYVTDAYNYTIRKITPAGMVTTLAGSARQEGIVDGTGSAARFYFPTGIVTDSSGNLYVSDTNNATIRKVTPAGVVTTFAGTAGSYGSADGTGSAARFYNPEGIAIDGGGNLYVTDSSNSTVRKIAPSDVVTTYAGCAPGSADGTGSAARFYNPYDVTVDGSGNVYVADSNNNTIRAITPAGVVTTLAGAAGFSGNGDGTGSAARFSYPEGVAMDSSGNIYVADSNDDTIRKIAPGGVVTTLAGDEYTQGSTDGTGGAARFNNPHGVAVDSSGNIYVADTYNSTIRKVTPAGVVTTLAGTAGVTGNANGTGTSAEFNYPQGLAVDGSGNVYVADSGNDIIREITPAGVVTTIAGLAGESGSSDGTGSAALFYSPDGIAVDVSGNLYVADSGNLTIRKITPVGVVSTVGGTPGGLGSNGGTGSAAQFYVPTGLTVDSNGNLYIADENNKMIRLGTPNSRASQTISFGSIANQAYGAAPITLSATASSGLPITYNVLFGPATLSGNTLTLTGSGSVTVEAIQSGNTSYLSAAPVEQTFLVTSVTSPPVLTSATTATATANSYF